MHKPAFYTRANNLQRRDAKEISDEFSHEFGQMSGRCLDIGSGPGDIAVDIILPKLNRNSTLLCLDISENMIHFAEKKYSDNRRLSFVKFDIESPNLASDVPEQFDHAISFYCLHWCKNMRQTFENVFRLLRPGGTAFLLFLSKSPVYDAFPNLAAMSRYEPYMRDADGLTPVFQNSELPKETLKALMENVGFRVHHCSIREMRYVFDTADMLSDFLLALYPFMERMPSELKKEYKEDLIKEVTKKMVVINNKNENINNEENHSTLFIYYTFVVYLKKPSNN